MEWKQGEFTITDNQEDLDIETIHNFLRESYWAKKIPRSIVEKAVNNSLCFGLYHNSKQVGFGRAVTDHAAFAYVGDVFVVPTYRGRGLGKWLVSCILAHPELQGLRRWLLAPFGRWTLRESRAAPVSSTCAPGMARNYVGGSPAAGFRRAEG